HQESKGHLARVEYAADVELGLEPTVVVPKAKERKAFTPPYEPLREELRGTAPKSLQEPLRVRLEGGRFIGRQALHPRPGHIRVYSLPILGGAPVDLRHSPGVKPASCSVKKV